MTGTKTRVIATIKAAINAPAPRLISFQYLSTFTDKELDRSCYNFTVNGMTFETDWVDSNINSFLDKNNVETSALTIQDLKLLLWWIEQPNTRHVKPIREPYHYLD